MWEMENEHDRFGTPMALMLLPMYTNGCMSSMEGLYFESTPNVPYHFLNQTLLSKKPSAAMRDLPYGSLNVSTGVDRLVQMGVGYYLTISPEAQEQAENEPRLQKLASTKADLEDPSSARTWILYEVYGAAEVTPLLFEPNVITDPGSIERRREEGKESSTLSAREAWIENQLEWYAKQSSLGIPVAADGPKEWPRIENASEDLVQNAIEDPARVARIGYGDNRISFRVENPGSPVIVHEGYFPNWKVEGAQGPYRISPSQMAVIPTTNEVTLYYGRTWVDYAGWFMTIVGLLGALAMWRIDRKMPPLRFARPLGVAKTEVQSEGLQNPIVSQESRDRRGAVEREGTQLPAGDQPTQNADVQPDTSSRKPGPPAE
jgi:hypothetical protein